MTSPTSSHGQSERAPDLAYRRIWLGAAALIALSLGVGELGARAMGLTPMVQDDARLWAFWRAKVGRSTEARQVVILGTSQMQLGVDPAVLGQMLGPRFEVLHLPINGGSPVPIFEELARDPDFGGIAIVGFNPMAFFGRKGSWEAKSEEFLGAYKGRGVSDDVEVYARTFFQARFSVLSPQLMPTTLMGTLLKTGSLPKPPYISSRFDRYLGADYSKVPITPADLGLDSLTATQELQSPIRDAVQMIRSRGGEVIFVRMPSSGDVAAAEEQWCPRELCFETFVRAVPEARFIHFRDDPRLAEFSCPDGGHLDVKDAGEFTRRLADVLALGGS